MSQKQENAHPVLYIPSQSHLCTCCELSSQENQTFGGVSLTLCHNKWLLATEPQDLPQVTSRRIHGERNGTDTDTFPVSSVFSCYHHSTIAPFTYITTPRGVR
jgi:hypothetical protein